MESLQGLKWENYQSWTALVEDNNNLDDSVFILDLLVAFWIWSSHILTVLLYTSYTTTTSEFLNKSKLSFHH